LFEHDHEAVLAANILVRTNHEAPPLADDPEAAVLDRSADAVRKAKIMALAMGLIGLGMALLGSFLAGR
jgi:predicted NBD/HSP70 family sugar kinase